MVAIFVFISFDIPFLIDFSLIGFDNSVEDNDLKVQGI